MKLVQSAIAHLIYDRKWTWLEKAINETPYLRDPYVEMALLQYEIGNYDKVIHFCNLALEILATFVLLGTPEPDLMLQAFFKSTAAGGVFVMKLKLLSAYTVITTGMITSPLSAVLALNCFVNSTMLTPCCPSAGPTGGAGVAFPAGICNLI